MQAKESTRSRKGSVLVLLSEAERNRFKVVAARSGLGVGPWLRMLGMRVADSVLRTKSPPTPKT